MFNGVLSECMSKECFTDNGRKFIFLETVRDVDELKNIRRDKFHCHLSYTGQSKMTMRCMNNRVSYKCDFKLLAQKTHQGRFHLYGSGTHKCSFNNSIKGQIFMRQNKQDNESKPPAVLTRTLNGVECKYDYLKTVHSLQELKAFRFKQQCDSSKVQKNNANFKFVQMPCYNAMPKKGSCPFALLACRPGLPDKNHIHVYARSSHNHSIIPIDKRIVQRHSMWSDEEAPPVRFSTSNGRNWIFMESTETKIGREDLVSFLKELKSKYNCIYRNMSVMEKRQTIAYHLTLDCITSSNGTNKCKYQLLAQRTDQGRYHLYTSDKHTCRHGKKAKDKSEEESEEDIEDEGNEMDDEEEEEHEECDEKLEEKEDEKGREMYAEKAEMIDDEEDNEQKHGRTRAMANDDEREEDVVKFVDFADHPKCEGVKMHRLGEPKKEPSADAKTITVLDEEPTNLLQNLKKPKLEIKEEVAEEQFGSSNIGQQVEIGTAAMPSAMINRQKGRWWAKETTPNKGNQRLLRERKRRINYLE